MNKIGFCTESELKEAAKEESKSIVFRTYENGWSKDEELKGTDSQRDTLFRILFGGLLSFNARSQMFRDESDARKAAQYIADTIEYVAQLEIIGANCYDTVYKRFKRTVEKLYGINVW